MAEQTIPNLDIKDFQSISSAQKLDSILMVLSNGLGAKVTIDLLIKILLRDIQPSINEAGEWIIGTNLTGQIAVGKSPFLQTSENGIEWKYEDETSFRPLVSYDQLKLKFSDLTQEQSQLLKLNFSDLTPADITELQQPAADAGKSIKDAELEIIKSEISRVAAFGTLKTASETATANAIETSTHPTYVGVDNYVYVWNSTTQEYDKTDICVKGESGVYIGSEEPIHADVWIDTHTADNINVLNVTINQTSSKNQTYTFTKENFDQIVESYTIGLPLFVNVTDNRAAGFKTIDLEARYCGVWNKTLSQLECRDIERGFYINNGTPNNRGCVTVNTNLYLSLNPVDFQFNPITGFYGYKDFINDITERQMEEIYAVSKQNIVGLGARSAYLNSTARVIYSVKTTWYRRQVIIDYTSILYHADTEIFVIDDGQEFLGCGMQITSSNVIATSMFRNAHKLRIIYGFIDVGGIKNSNTLHQAFDTCNALERVHIRNIKVNLSFAKSHNLSEGSIIYMLTNRANNVGEAITVTLHATAYQRAINSSEIQTLLSETDTQGAVILTSI